MILKNAGKIRQSDPELKDAEVITMEIVLSPPSYGLDLLEKYQG